VLNILQQGPSSARFGDSVLAAARRKRWVCLRRSTQALGVSRQAKGREFDQTMVEFFTLLDGVYVPDERKVSSLCPYPGSHSYM
jgi:hypothetical protein